LYHNKKKKIFLPTTVLSFAEFSGITVLQQIFVKPKIELRTSSHLKAAKRQAVKNLLLIISQITHILNGNTVVLM
jgi:hypothetical protein